MQVRPTVFLQNFFFTAWAAESIAKGATIRLPLGTGRADQHAVGSTPASLASQGESLHRKRRDKWLHEGCASLVSPYDQRR